MKSITKFVERAILIGAATICFLVTLLLALEDKASSATVTAAMGFGFALLHFLPVFESIEGFGLSAKLRSQVTEASALLDGIRKTAIAASRLSYVQIAWMNRMGVPSWASKRALLAELDDNLKSLLVEEEVLKSIKEPFLRFVSLDLYRTFERVVAERLAENQRRVQEIINSEYKGTIVQDERYLALVAEKRSFERPKSMLGGGIEDEKFANIRVAMRELTFELVLPEADKAALLTLSDRIASLSEGCWATGTISSDAEEYLNTYQGLQGKTPLFDETFRR